MLGKNGAFSFALGNKGDSKPRPACANLSPVVQIGAGSDIISARESGARNLRCTGNNRLGGCSYSERFASQIEKALGRR